MATEHDIVRILRHRLWIEEPYTLVIKADGDMDVDGARQIADLLDKVGQGQGPIIILQDMTKAGGFPAQAREIVTRDERSRRIEVVISFGVNFHLRMILTMLGRAMGWLRRYVPRMIFAANEAEARAILETEREKFRQQSPTA